MTPPPFFHASEKKKWEGVGGRVTNYKHNTESKDNSVAPSPTLPHAASGAGEGVIVFPPPADSLPLPPPRGRGE